MFYCRSRCGYCDGYTDVYIGDEGASIMFGDTKESEGMIIHSAVMINTSLVLFFVAFIFIPWFIGLYNPENDIINGKALLDEFGSIGSAVLFVGGSFLFLVGTGWLAVSTLFYGMERIFDV